MIKLFRGVFFAIVASLVLFPSHLVATEGQEYIAIRKEGAGNSGCFLRAGLWADAKDTRSLARRSDGDLHQCRGRAGHPDAHHPAFVR